MHSTASTRDRWVVALREPRPAHDPQRYRRLLVEDERSADGSIVQVATVFLTGRECPWRCVMCDLWKETNAEDTPPGAIPGQITLARAELAARGAAATHIKLYNSGSFFDPRAVPLRDYDSIAAVLHGFDRIIVESHPSLIGAQVDKFLYALHAAESPSPAALEVAMGLETVHAGALERLNKRMTTGAFEAAADRLAGRGVALRVFLLISPPFVPAAEQDEWLLRSVQMAVAVGASAISLIPTRGGNGAMEALALRREFTRPRLVDVERSVDLALGHAGGRARIFVDLWDLEQLAACLDCFDARRARLNAINLSQELLPPVDCAACAAGR